VQGKHYYNDMFDKIEEDRIHQGKAFDEYFFTKMKEALGTKCPKMLPQCSNIVVQTTMTSRDAIGLKFGHYGCIMVSGTSLW
jgi:hypothetical protein